MKGARAVLETIPGVTVEKCTKVKGLIQLGVAEFHLRDREPLDRADFVERMAAKQVFVCSIERTDRPMPESLRCMQLSARKDAHNGSLSEHPAVAEMLSALALLRGWRSAVRSANSEFAVTPRLDELLQIVEGHIDLLTKRGFILERQCMVSARPRLKRKVDAIIKRKTIGGKKLWKYSGRTLAAAARTLEVPIFAYQIRELQKIATEAEVMAKKVAKKSPRAAEQHQTTRVYALRMARMLTRALEDLSIQN